MFLGKSIADKHLFQMNFNVYSFIDFAFYFDGLCLIENYEFREWDKINLIFSSFIASLLLIEMNKIKKKEQMIV